nr:MAG TPA: hypothetical protein [Caudoviricetes sp.]
MRRNIISIIYIFFFNPLLNNSQGLTYIRT